MKQYTKDKLSYWTRRDGRRSVAVFRDGKRIRSTSLARYLMEDSLGRPLSSDELVHHVNGDRTDDRLENLLVLSPSEHRMTFGGNPPTVCTCPECGKEFSRRTSDVNWSIKHGKGIFCTRTCAATHHWKERRQT